MQGKLLGESPTSVSTGQHCADFKRSKLTCISAPSLKCLIHILQVLVIVVCLGTHGVCRAGLVSQTCRNTREGYLIMLFSLGQRCLIRSSQALTPY
jgi:hypothetical protein